MTRATWMAAGLPAAFLAALAGTYGAFAQAPGPTTRPVPFIKPLPEPEKPPATKPAGAPYIQPITQPADPTTTKPAAGPFIKPIKEPVTRPATAPSTGPASRPTTEPATKPAGKPPEVGRKTQGFSNWVPVEPGQRCTDLSLMPADVRKLWLTRCTTRGRILAERAAKAAAVARLARRVGEMSIAPGLTVRQFLATTDQPDAGEELFLRGAAVRATRYHADKLVLEVELEIRSRTVFASLKGWSKSHIRGDRAGLRQVETMLLKADDAMLRQTGPGTPPAGEILEPTPGLLRATKAATQPATQPVSPVSQPVISLPATKTTR